MCLRFSHIATNQAKWAAAEDFCKDRKWEFQILTEKELGI